MFRCCKTTRKASVTIKLEEDRAVVSYSIDPRHPQKEELHFKLTLPDVAQSISDSLKREVIDEETYRLSIVVSSSQRRDSTECNNLSAKKTRETLDSFITSHVKQQMSQAEEKPASKTCAIL